VWAGLALVCRCGTWLPLVLEQGGRQANTTSFSSTVLQVHPL
jgi:hypothetical protein